MFFFTFTFVQLWNSNQGLYWEAVLDNLERSKHGFFSSFFPSVEECGVCKYYQVFGGGRKRKILLLKERSKKWKPHQELLKTMFKLPNLWVLKVFLLLRKFCTKYLNTKSKRTLQELWIFSNLTLMPGHNCCRLFVKCNLFIIVHSV